MRSQQELSDRLEIGDLITAYSYAIDFHRFDDLDTIFTDGATLDLTATGGISGPLPQVKQWLASVLVNFAGHQHLVATSQVMIDGDTATARSVCHNPMYLPDKDDGCQQVIFVGIWYHDTFTRTSEGWRIAARTQQKGYLHRLPAG